MGQVIVSFWGIAVIMIIGYLLAKYGVTRQGADAALSRITFYSLMPALLFRTVSNADLSTAFTTGAIVSVSSAIILGAIFLTLSRYMFISGPDRTIGTLCSGYTNAGNIGVAYLMATTGDPSPVAPIMIFQLCFVTPIVFTILGRQTGRTHASFPTTIVRSLITPPVIGVLSGLAVAAFHIDVPDLISGPINQIASAAVPMMLLTLGISFYGAGIPKFRESAPLLTACFLRCIASPALCFGLGLALGLEGVALQSITIAGSIPVANNVFVFAHRYGAGINLAREAILLSTVGSLIVTLGIAWAFHSFG